MSADRSTSLPSTTYLVYDYRGVTRSRGVNSRVYTSATCCAATSCVDEQHLRATSNKLCATSCLLRATCCFKQHVARDKQLVARNMLRCWCKRGIRLGASHIARGVRLGVCAQNHCYFELSTGLEFTSDLAANSSKTECFTAASR